MNNFKFTKEVRSEAVKFVKNVGRIGGVGSNLLAVFVGADLTVTAVGGFVLYLVTHGLALYLTGLQTRKDVEKK